MEIFTAVHKTGRSAVKKSVLLPILVPAIGITGNNWAACALEVFDAVGLVFDGKIDGPLLRPPSHQGPFLCQRGVTSSEVGKLLRGLVGEPIDIADPQMVHISAHSLKATGLAWAARFGMSWPDRAILGRHQSHTNETVAIYSRDLAVGPVSRFAEVLSAIGRGAFCPDAERSRYFPFPPLPLDGTQNVDTGPKAADDTAIAQENHLECKFENAASEFADSVIVIADSDSESSESAGSASGDESFASEDMEPPAKKGIAANVARIPRHGSWVAHDPSGGNEARRTTARGRTVTGNFVEMDSSTEGNAICVMCQQRQ